jgi:hypothetical protein
MDQLFAVSPTLQISASIPGNLIPAGPRRRGDGPKLLRAWERTPSESGCAPSRAKIKNLERKLSRDAPKARHGIGQCLEWERYSLQLVWFDRSTSCQCPAASEVSDPHTPLQANWAFACPIRTPPSSNARRISKKPSFRGRAERHPRTGVLLHLLSSPPCQFAEADRDFCPWIRCEAMMCCQRPRSC